MGQLRSRAAVDALSPRRLGRGLPARWPVASLSRQLLQLGRQLGRLKLGDTAAALDLPTQCDDSPRSGESRAASAFGQGPVTLRLCDETHDRRSATVAPRACRQVRPGPGTGQRHPSGSARAVETAGQSRCDRSRPELGIARTPPCERPRRGCFRQPLPIRVRLQRRSPTRSVEGLEVLNPLPDRAATTRAYAAH
jgi:hypothetical protein